MGKVCTKCGIEQELSQFRRRAAGFFADCKACHSKRNARHYRLNVQLISSRTMAWQLANPERNGFNQHRNHAKARGIEFLMSFREWRDWWGADYKLRGGQPSDLCMGRYSDEGAYVLGNVYKVSMSENREGPRPFPQPGF